MQTGNLRLISIAFHAQINPVWDSIVQHSTSPAEVFSTQQDNFLPLVGINRACVSFVFFEMVSWPLHQSDAHGPSLKNESQVQ
jgi:hypothetical protein